MDNFGLFLSSDSLVPLLLNTEATGRFWLHLNALNVQGYGIQMLL